MTRTRPPVDDRNRNPSGRPSGAGSEVSARPARESARTAAEATVDATANPTALSFEPIAAWLQLISAETTVIGLATALLKAATELPGVERGVTILSDRSQIFETASAGLPRDLKEVIVTSPAKTQFKLADSMIEYTLEARRAIVFSDRRLRSAFSGFEDLPVTALCVPLSHKDHVVGMLYLEAASDCGAFDKCCVTVASILASQASVSLDSARLFQELRETHKWMTRGQQVGRMGNYRFNTRTGESRGSKEAYEIFGLDTQLKPVPFPDFLATIHPDDRPNLEAAIEEARESLSPFRHEYRVIHKDGTVLDLIAVGEWETTEFGDLELEGIISDVTASKTAQRALADAKSQLERASGLASLGEIAGSIVHEINQPLTALIAGAEASIRWLSRDEPNIEEAKATMRRTLDSGRRAADVVQSLRSLARRSNMHFLEIEIDDVFAEAMLLARPDLDRWGVILRADLKAPDMLVYGDKIQLQQVVLNLVRNAAEAMREIKGRPRLLTVASAINGDVVTLGFHDTGPGISEDHRGRLFEALYTTKKTGLGLGLAICRKIINAHDGRIWVENNDPVGSSFYFTLPVQCRQD